MPSAPSRSGCGVSGTVWSTTTSSPRVMRTLIGLSVAESPMLVPVTSMMRLIWVRIMPGVTGRSGSEIRPSDGSVLRTTSSCSSYPSGTMAPEVKRWHQAVIMRGRQASSPRMPIRM